jgi:hypothetical protein
MVYRELLRILLSRPKQLKNPLAWSEKTNSVVNRYNDIIGWFGGLPYETATKDEVIEAQRAMDLLLSGQRFGERARVVRIFQERQAQANGAK